MPRQYSWAICLISVLCGMYIHQRQLNLNQKQVDLNLAQHTLSPNVWWYECTEDVLNRV